MTPLVQQFQSLVARKLATQRFHPTHTSWAIYKYSKRVFFDGLWDEDPLIADARGIVVDTETGEIIQYPFTKVYNYTERGAGDDLTDDTVVIAPEKINGFMASVSKRPTGELLITTSGSFESPFVDMATEVLMAPTLDLVGLVPGRTYIFEIVHKNDPHIIPTQEGAYLIGARDNHLGSAMSSEFHLDSIANLIWAMRPPVHKTTIADIRKMNRERTDIEGFMIRDATTQETICKWKGTHYLRLKFLTRASFFLVEGFDREKLRQTVEEEFYPAIDFIYDGIGVEVFKSLKPEQRVPMLAWIVQHAKLT